MLEQEGRVSFEPVLGDETMWQSQKASYSVADAVILFFKDLILICEKDKGSLKVACPPIRIGSVVLTAQVSIGRIHSWVSL